MKEWVLPDDRWYIVRTGCFWFVMLVQTFLEPLHSEWPVDIGRSSETLLQKNESSTLISYTGFPSKLERCWNVLSRPSSDVLPFTLTIGAALVSVISRRSSHEAACLYSWWRLSSSSILVSNRTPRPLCRLDLGLPGLIQDVFARPW